MNYTTKNKIRSNFDPADYVIGDSSTINGYWFNPPQPLDIADITDLRIEDIKSFKQMMYDAYNLLVEIKSEHNKLKEWKKKLEEYVHGCELFD